MPTYPSNYNDPTTTVNNVTDLRELVNPVAAGNQGDPLLVNPTNTYGDLATALNKLLVKLYQVKTQVIGTYDINDPSGLSGTTNANITAHEQTYVAVHFALKMAHIQARALDLARDISNLQADINTAVGASGAQTPVDATATMPSDQNRGW